jgi:hypothetical protein
MVRLKKRNPVSRRQESRVVGIGNSIKVIRYCNLFPVAQSKGSNVFEIATKNSRRCRTKKLKAAVVKYLII